MFRLLQLTPCILPSTMDSWAEAVCPWKDLDVRSLPVVFSLVPCPGSPSLGISLCLVSQVLPLISPPSSITASILDPGSVFQLPLCLLFLQLSPPIHLYVSTHLLLGSRLYIMGAPLSIIYLHMYHSCLQPSIIHHLSCRLFDVLHSAPGWGWGDGRCQACLPQLQRTKAQKDVEGTERTLESG